MIARLERALTDAVNAAAATRGETDAALLELVGSRLLQIRPEVVAGTWRVAILNLYRYACLLDI